MTDRSLTFAPGASWIWSADARRPYHNVVCFRRSFEAVAAGVATLRITADTRYEAYVNGRRLGFGPVRAWPAEWPVDTYDLTGLLHDGVNTVAVLAHHFGIGTFQSLHAAPGLIADIHYDAGDTRRSFSTDTAWRCQPSAAHLWPVPRISCMQAWEEQFDARLLPADWTLPTFDDARWSAATVVCVAGKGEHPVFVPRDIPMLTDDPTPAVRVLAVETVKPAPYVWAINPRDLLHPFDKTADYVRGRLLLTTRIVSEAEQAIEFHRPTDRPWVDWKLNGQPLAFDDRTLQKTDTGVAFGRLAAGENTLTGRLKVEEHYWWATLSAWTSQPVTLCSPKPGPTAWLALGPFVDANDDRPSATGLSRHVVHAARPLPGATPAVFERLWEHGVPSEDDLAAPYAQPVTADMVAVDDIYARCASERVERDAEPNVEAAEALLHDNADWTVVHPSAVGDVRFLLDFGREVVGFHEFELDAPAGTVVDVHNFEFIQPDGRFNLCEGMNNSFRYICREGPQQYRTLVRRGFRYSWVSLRSFDRPVRVRLVRVRMSTYPQARRGRFACSDPMLDRIWEVGAHTVACCSEDAYTDCPTYEQTFWVGDGRNEAMVDLIANGDPRLSARSLRLAAGSLRRSPLVESQVPSAWENILPAWSFLWMRWAQEHFEWTGDVESGREMVDAVAKNVAGLQGFVSPRGLIRIDAWNMFDWAAMDTPSGGEVTHLNCLAVLGLRQAAGLARGVEDTTRATAWDAFADRLTAAINTHLWDDATLAYIDCIRPTGERSPVFSQQTQTAAYIAGVAADTRAERCHAIMHAAPPGFVTAGSPFFMFFFLEGLIRDGEYDRMLQTIRDYWGPQIEAGATTFWEMYHRGRARMTRSHCHGWSAAPTFFLSRYVLGVSPLAAGFSRISIAPRPGDLRWARGAVPTPRGVIDVAWTRGDGNAFELRLSLPDDMQVEIVWPVASEPQVTTGRLHDRRAGGVWVVSGRTLVLRSPPGSGPDSFGKSGG